MKLVVDIPEDILNRIDEAVQQGEYDNPNYFVTLALRNQLELETNYEEHDMVPDFNEYFATDNDGQPDPTELKQTKLGVQQKYGVETTSTPGLDYIESGPLWGQYNRIFPVKIVVRALANRLSQTRSDSIEFEKFRTDAATTAREIGLQLKDIDQEVERSRGEKLSSGLPVGESPEKSLSRFREQFVGRVNKNDNLGGASAALKFVNISDDSIGITEHGLAFARLQNPLIDNDLSEDNSLSSDEKSFYLSHVNSELPAEMDAMRMVAENIADGYNRPNSLTDKVSEIDPEWSEAQANTMRTGLVSRMFELGFVRRERVETHGVAYVLTDQVTKSAPDGLGVEI